jgi:prepilin-type N-terminal cleavage/methylation domain-containing protein
MRSRNSRGFSLVEMMLVVAIIFIMMGIVTIAFGPSLLQQHVNEGYSATLMALRRAHDQAQNDMRIYVATFTPPGTISVQQAGANVTTCPVNAPTGNVILSNVMPADITYHVEPGVPTNNVNPPLTPDQFGTAAAAVDLDAANQIVGINYICFFPDGTVQDFNGNIGGGVIYLGHPGALYTSRAITVFGATARLRGWQLYNVNGVNTWVQQ